MSMTEHRGHTAPAASPWEHKDLWSRRGRDFMVQVSRHGGSADSDLGTGPHRWCLYAYIYPKHPYFAKFEGPAMWQYAAVAMPLHCGPSLLEYPMYEGKVTSIKVGADYNHLYDDAFTHYATQDEAREVFFDAAVLFDWLQERAESAEGRPPVKASQDGLPPDVRALNSGVPQ